MRATWRRTHGGRENRENVGTGWPTGYGLSDPAAIPPPGMYQMNRAGVPVTPHTSMQVDAVHTSLRVLSNAIIKTGDLYSYTWANDAQGRPYKVRDSIQPNILTNTFGPGNGAGGLQSWQYNGRRQLVISMALFGEAFTYTLERDYLGFPRTIEVLAPMFVGLEKDKQTGANVWTYGSGNNKIILDNNNLTHIPFITMPGAARGLSGIEYGGINFALALAALEYGQRWFAQGASPSYLLSTEMKLGPDEVKRIAETFLVEHSGLQAAHLPLVLDSGMKASKISSTPDEAQYLATLTYTRNCIGAWFGLPAHLIGGDADKGNLWGKSLQEQSYQMVDFTLSGYFVPLAEAHSSWLARGHYAAFNEHALLKANYEDMAALISSSRTAGIHTQNDIRTTYFDLPPEPGGDDINAELNSAPRPQPAAEPADKAEPSATDK